MATLAAVEARAQSQKDESVSIRRALLRDYLEARRGSAAVAPYLPAAFGVLTLGLGVGVAIGGFGEDDSGRSRWVFAGTSVGASAVSFAAYAAPVDYRYSMVDASLGLLAIGTGAGFYVSSRAEGAIRFSSAAIMGTGLVYGGLAIADAALLRPISPTTLHGHLDRLARDGRISSDELGRIERDFARTERPVPRWAFALTLGIGGLMAAAPVFAGDTNEDDRAVSAVLGTMLLAPALTSIVPIIVSDRNGYSAYEKALRNVRLTPLGPAGSSGLTLSAAF